MKNFIEFLKRKGIIPYLKKVYKISSNKEVDKEIFERIIGILVNATNFEKLNKRKKLDANSNLDLIAWIYENNVSKEQRKILGEFYTPSQIVDYILNSVEYSYKKPIENQKLIDISCGSGSFIVKAIERLVSKFLRNFNVINISSLTIREAKDLVLKVSESIAGIDINPIACILCQLNIYFSLFEVINIILEKDEDYLPPIFNISHSNTLEFDFIQKYDYVVGNPPYVFIRDIVPVQRKLIENGNFETAIGQYDYYQIFIEIGIMILKEHGFLGYIVPDSLLALSNRKSLRKYIYSNTMIKKIVVVGSGFKDPVVSSIIIVLQKELNEENRLSNKILIKGTLENNRRENLLLQKDIPEWDYKYLIHLNQMDINILKHLNSKFPKLKSLMDDSKFSISINRGVELGKDGKIIFCNHCKKYFPLPKSKLICIKCGARMNSKNIDKIIVETLPEDSEGTYELFIYKLNRYSVKEYRYIRMNVEGINYKDSNNYLNRIVIRQLSQENHICAAYEEKALSSQSVYNVKIHRTPIEEFNHFYILGLLNSQLLSYYFLKTFGSYKLLFPRILIEKLKIFPIKVPLTQNERELSNLIIDNVKEIINLKPNNKTQLLKVENQIDFLVNKLYLINEDMYNHIIKSLPDLSINKN